MRAVIVLGALLGLLVVTTPATAQLYTWTDDNGVVHYTADPSSIPPQYRPADLQPMPSAAPASRGWESWCRDGGPLDREPGKSNCRGT